LGCWGDEGGDYRGAKGGVMLEIERGRGGGARRGGDGGGGTEGLLRQLIGRGAWGEGEKGRQPLF